MSYTKPVSVGLMTDAEMNEQLVKVRAAGCTVEHDTKAGTVIAKDGETVVLKGIQKGSGGPWIVALCNSDRVTWSPVQCKEDA